MMRTLAALASLVALASCGVIGPPQGDLQTAVQAFYDEGAPPGTPELSGAEIADFEGCRPSSNMFKCPVAFATATGTVHTIVWVARAPNGWRVQRIELNVLPTH